MSPQSSKPRVAIVGAGPAGLMAALHLAKSGVQVEVFEQKAAPARKLLMAGRGGLNLTHTTSQLQALAKYGDARGYLETGLKNFTPADLRQWSNDLGEPTFVGSSGKVFPRSLKASPLLRAWLLELDRLGVVLHLKHRWVGWTADSKELQFIPTLPITTPTTPDAHSKLANPEVKRVAADATLLALGGASWPHLGSDGAWAETFHQFGLDVARFSPANAGFCVQWSPHLLERHSGAPVKNIALTCHGETQRGEIVITRYGLEGGVCYAFNPHVREALKQAPSITLTINLKPDVSLAQLSRRLAEDRGRRSVNTHIQKKTGLSPAAIALLREPGAGTLPAEANELAELIQNLPVTCTGLAPISRAISTAGGVTFDSLSADYMLKQRPGVFVAGEMMDWEAPTGGYLLQATFATAITAADGILKYLDARVK